MKAKYFLSTCALACGVVASPAAAQAASDEVKPQTQTQAAPTDTTATQDLSNAFGNAIIVTAQRKEEALQKAALPIVAATGEQLANAGVSDVTGLNKIAPSLNIVNQAGSATSFFIRGVGTYNNNNLSDSAVAFNYDGVYVARPSATSAFLDVDRVEVLKGPQGTLYGRNATGGAINVIPVHPKLNEFSGFVSGTYGNYDAYELTGAINAPLGENAAIRLSGIVDGHDPYFDDGTGDAKNLALRGQVYVKITPTLDMRFHAEYATKDGVGPGNNLLGAYVLTPNIFQPGVPTTIPNYTYFSAPNAVSKPFTGIYTPASLAYFSQFRAAPLFTNSDDLLRPSVNDEIWGIHAEMNLDLGNATVTVIPAYRSQHLRNQYTAGVFRGALDFQTSEQFSVEGRVAGSAGPVDYVAGLFYFDENTSFVGSFNQWGVQNNPNSDGSTTSWAAFSRLSYNVTDKLRLVGGIRYTDDKKSIDATQPGLVAICLAAAPPNCSSLPGIPVGLTIEESIASIDPALFVSGLTPLDVPLGVPVPYIADFSQPAIMFRTLTSVNEKRSFDKVTWRGAIEFDVTPRNLLYASYESGFRSGGFNIAFGRESFDPEYIDAYTIGSKNRFFDGLLQLNLEAFIWKYRGQQLSHLGLDLRGNNSFFTENIGRSTLEGVDIDFVISPTRTTQISGSVQYLDANNDSLVYQVPNQNQPGAPEIVTPLTGCAFSNSNVDTINGPIPTYAVDCSGTRPLNAPKWTFNLGLDQIFEIGNYELVANLSGRYRSNRELDFSYLPTSHSGQDFTADASLTLRPADRNWFVSAFVRNLTDEDVLTNFAVGTPGVAAVAYEPPRTYGLRLGYDF